MDSVTERVIRLLCSQHGVDIPQGWYFKRTLYTEPAIPLIEVPALTVLITDDPNDMVTFGDTNPNPGMAEYIEGRYRDAKAPYPNAWGAPASEFREDRNKGELHPEYYQTESGLEPWDVIRAFHLDYWRGTAVAYLLRAGRKPDSEGGNGAIDDIRKAWTFLGERLRDLEKEAYPLHVVRGSDLPNVQYSNNSPLDKE